MTTAAVLYALLNAAIVLASSLMLIKHRPPTGIMQWWCRRAALGLRAWLGEFLRTRGRQMGLCLLWLGCLLNIAGLVWLHGYRDVWVGEPIIAVGTLFLLAAFRQVESGPVAVQP